MTTGTGSPAAKQGAATSRTKFYAMAGVAALGVIVAAMLFFRSGKASEVNLTSAQLVPEDAAVFVGINTDLDSSQWVAAFGLAKKLGADDPQQDLIDSAKDNNLDWEHEVQPFLGGDAALFITGLSTDVGGAGGATPFRGGIILRARNASAAAAVLRERASDTGVHFSRVDYGGGTYEAASDRTMFMAILEEHLVLTADEQSLRDVIDVNQRRKGSLADSQVFRDVRDSITRNFLAFSYVDATRMLDRSQAFKDALKDAGFDLDQTKPYAGAITAEQNAFAFQQAVPASNAPSAAMQPRESALAGRFPAETVLFASTAGIASMWEKAPEGASLEDVLPPLALPFAGMGDPFGGEDMPTVDRAKVDALMALLTGETSVALWDAGGLEPEGAMLAQVADEGRARAAALALVFDGGSRPSTKQTVKGVDLYSGDGVAVAVFDGLLAIGTPGAVQRVIEGPDKTLAGGKAYRDAVARLPTPLGSFLFLNFGPLFEDKSFDLPITDALQSLIINVVQNEGFGRASGVLTVQE